MTELTSIQLGQVVLRLFAHGKRYVVTVQYNGREQGENTFNSEDSAVSYMTGLADGYKVHRLLSYK